MRVWSLGCLGRSPGGGHGNPLQYSCLENPMDRGAWRATVHGVAKSLTRLKWLSTDILYAVVCTCQFQSPNLSLPSPNCPPDNHKFISYIERLLLNTRRCRDSWLPEEKNSILGQRWGLITQSFCAIEFLKYKRDRESFWHRHQKGQKEYPLASVSIGIIFFLISYYSESKECLEVVKTSLDLLP